MGAKSTWLLLCCCANSHQWVLWTLERGNKSNFRSSPGRSSATTASRVFSHHEQPPSSVSTFMASPEEEIGVEKGRNESIRTIVSKRLDQYIHDKSMTRPSPNQSFSLT